jgi:uncharacterized protein (UPF0548 family)
MRPLPPERIDGLARRPLTYAPPGATRSAAPPPGFGHHEARRVLPHGDLDAAAAALLGWRVQERIGLRVAASAPAAAPGVVVLIGAPLVPFGAACRVVYTVDEADRRGFAYGTLEGHPVSGEELFLLERDGTGRVVFTVRAFSRPALALTRCLGPLTRVGQRVLSRRYLAALDDV